MPEETTVAETGHEGATGHVSPLWQLAAVWAALAGLTVLTVAATHIDLGGSGNLWLAMIIATVKAALVALYFMHMRYERGIIALIFLGTLVFVMFMVSLTLIDTAAYRPDIIPGYAPGINQ
jgi:cytochrome c oxidase subunit IV